MPVNIIINKEGKMKNVIAQMQSVNHKAAWAAFAIAAAILMVAIAGGLDSVLPGAHDVFHEARHAAGIPCH